MVNEEFDVVIIGSGVGGLGAGFYLQANNTNIQTFILE